MNRTTPSGTMVLIVGALVFGMTLAAWLYAASHGIDPGPLFYMAGPVVASLFVAPSLGKAADAAQQAAQQTNGALDARIKAGVSAALADRDSARTRQQLGDVSEQTGDGPPRPPAGGIASSS